MTPKDPVSRSTQLDSSPVGGKLASFGITVGRDDNEPMSFVVGLRAGSGCDSSNSGSE